MVWCKKLKAALAGLGSWIDSSLLQRMKIFKARWTPKILPISALEPWTEVLWHLLAWCLPYLTKATLFCYASSQNWPCHIFYDQGDKRNEKGKTKRCRWNPPLRANAAPPSRVPEGDFLGNLGVPRVVLILILSNNPAYSIRAPKTNRTQTITQASIAENRTIRG